MTFGATLNTAHARAGLRSGRTRRGFVGSSAVAGSRASATAGRITALKMATSFVSPPPRISREVAPIIEPRRGPRYTVDGSDALESQIHVSCELIRDAVLRRLPSGSIEGLLLGGGYGRGEGGVLATPDGERPY